jgi:prevent-host-death family protein
MKTISASNAKKRFGDFIKMAQQEEIIILKNSKPILRVTPIHASRSELIDELFDWGITGLKNEDIMEGMLEKYYGK